MFTPYVDFHIHTDLSDGVFTPQQVINQARDAGIRVMAITDHNSTQDLTLLRQANPDMQLLQGAEISCMYTAPSGKEFELHVVGLGFDPNNEKIRAVLKQNQPDRRPYIEAILARLRENGIFVGSYDSIRKDFPDTKHLGRMHVAKTMVKLGYVASVDEAFDLYIGAFGERRAFVPNMLRYVSLEEAVSAILAAGGIPILCHLYYYPMDDAEREQLVKYFKLLAGDRAAMEVFYGKYPAEQRLQLLNWARKYGLMPSAGSDYHGQETWETLEKRFSYTACSRILNRLGIQIPNAVQAPELLVFSGFSGVGKAAISKLLFAKGQTVNGKPLFPVTSVTTREPRNSDDRYTFVSRAEFAEMVAGNRLLEHNDAYSKNGYGTPISEIRFAMEQGMLPCLEIDSTGLMNLLTQGRVDPERIRSVFIAAQADDIIHRLKKRGSEPTEEIIRRLGASLREARRIGVYKSVVINDYVESAAEKVLKAFGGSPCADPFDAESFSCRMEEILAELQDAPSNQ